MSVTSAVYESVVKLNDKSHFRLDLRISTSQKSTENRNHAS